MISKVCTGLLLVNLIFISSCYCKSLENKVTLSTTTRKPNTSSPSPVSPTEKISDQISTWSNLVNQLKVQKEEGEDIVRLTPLLPLTYKIYKFDEENKQILQNDKQLKKKFSSLKTDIPEPIRNLFWGSKCAIRNAQDKNKYLKVLQPSRTSQAFTFELGKGTKSYWNFQPFLEKLSENVEEKVVFLIQNFDTPNDLLGIKSVEQPNADEWGNDGGNLAIIPALQNGPGKMIKWTLEPFISAGGPSKGEIVNWMSTEDPHPVDPKILYLHGSFKAAPIFRLVDGSAWVFECVA